jgi:hypothetical protein
VKTYLEELRSQSGRSLEKKAEGVLGKIQKAKKKFMGFESDETKKVIPFPPVTLASWTGSTANLPTTVPSYKISLLPNMKVSPEIGIGMGGIQSRLIIKRRPDEVPKDSVVGTGLENQKAVSGGADLSLKLELKKDK